MVTPRRCRGTRRLGWKRSRKQRSERLPRLCANRAGGQRVPREQMFSEQKTPGGRPERSAGRPRGTTRRVSSGDPQPGPRAPQDVRPASHTPSAAPEPPASSLAKRRLALTGSCIPSPGGDPGLRQDPRTEDSRPRSDPDFKDKPRSWETVRGRQAGRGP